MKHTTLLLAAILCSLIVLGGYGILSWLARELYGFIGVLPELYEGHFCR